MPRIKAIVLYFLMVLGAGFALGVVRVPFLVPRLGERYAELLEMPIMLVVIVLSARYVVRRFRLAPHFAVRLQVGFSALALSVAAELLLAAFLQSQSLGQYIGSRDPVSGSVYLLLLLVFALMPAILGRIDIRRSRPRHG
ncbi:MAG TPA: hypothetical protein PKC03_00915 [Dokdonella sp.]|nr:hypothetical protein [Dokdonella sp.]